MMNGILKGFASNSGVFLCNKSLLYLPKVTTIPTSLHYGCRGEEIPHWGSVPSAGHPVLLRAGTSRPQLLEPADYGALLPDGSSNPALSTPV